VKPVDTIKNAAGTPFEDEDGNIEKLKVLPPLTPEEFRELENGIPCTLPDDARELLEYSRGFDGILESIDFSGLLPGFGMEEIFPHAVPIAHDGFGNYWVVDLTAQSTTWGPIFFVCHDAPVIVFQTNSLAHFIDEVIKLGNSPWISEINEVHEKHHDKIWHQNPGLLTVEQGRQSADLDLKTFAQSLDDSWWMIDLREAKVGDGFSWGRYGPGTVIRRFGEKRIFAIQKKKSLWQRILNR
jgi:hypothetical protein